MKKQLSLYTLLISLLFFSACTEDDINQDCFTCERTETEYCINETDNFYTVTVDGISTEVLLENELWADIRVQLLEECENPTETECFNCNDTGIEYCYTTGDDFYTIEIADHEIQEIPLNDNSWQTILDAAREICPDIITDCYTCESEDITYCYTEGDDFYTVGNLTDDCDGDNIPDYLDPDTCDTEEQILLEELTWEEIKTELETDCPIIEQDCYTCVSENTEYCYIEGNDFYIATVNDVDTQIDLNGQTWEEIKVQLESDCPPTQTTGNIVGVWTVTEYTGAKEIKVNGTLISTSTYEAISFDNFQWTFTENPNEMFQTGSYILNLIIYDLNGNPISEQDNSINTDPTIVETWNLNGTNLELSTNFNNGSDTTIEQFDVTVLELTETSLKLRYNTILNTSGGVQNIDEIFFTFVR